MGKDDGKGAGGAASLKSHPGHCCGALRVTLLL